MARAERLACIQADVVAAISPVDVEGFRAQAPAARVRLLPVLWQAAPAGATETLAGAPPFICIGSFDWRPNRDGALWLLREVWPLVRAALPDAVLHVAGPGSASLPRPDCGGVVLRGSVEEAGPLYDPRGIVLIPLRAGSGVRLRLLEAWANGLPAVTTTVGGEGLVAGDGDGAIVAASAPAFADAALRIALEPVRREELVAQGRVRLAGHDPGRVIDTALSIYDEAVRVSRGARSDDACAL
jgi:glycosyltransferase involved in cell wall biosynthesis